MVSEKLFCIKTNIYTRRVEIFELVKAVTKFKPVVEYYKAILESCEIPI